MLPIQTQRKLNHENILQTVDSWNGVDHYYILLELCESVCFGLLFFRFNSDSLQSLYEEMEAKYLSENTIAGYIKQSAFRASNLAKSVLSIL